MPPAFTFALVFLFHCVSRVNGKVFHTQMNGRVVQTQYGKLRGVLVSLPSRDLPQVEAYLGLQYASVLDGDLRFMPPTSPLEKWQGIRVALKHRPVCPQILPNITRLAETLPTGRLDHIRKILPFLRDQSEECLYLNVYVPVRGKNETEPLPVLVFIHGETFEMGTGNAYDGSVMAAFGRVVVVTINYRLGVLGFLSSGDSNAPGNYALLDIVAALHWVRENVAAFGGNPENVVLLGQGYGGAMVHFLLVSPVTKGRNLYKRVIIQSGSALSVWALNTDPLRYTEQLAQHVNCSEFWGKSAQLVQCFKNKPIEDLLTSDIRAPKYYSTWAPVIDHRSVLPSDVRHLMSEHEGEFMNTDILLGVMKNEGFLYFPQHEIDMGVTERRMRQITRTLVRNVYQWHRQAIYDVILHYYTNWDMPHDKEAIRDGLMEMLGDVHITAPMMELVRSHARLPASTHFYTFTYPSRLDTYPQWAGGVHGDDMTYVFGAPLTDGVEPFLSSFTRSEKTLSETILTYWTNFIHSGNPNSPELVDGSSDTSDENRFTDLQWPEYDNLNQKYIQIGVKPVDRSHYQGSRMALWLDLIPKLHRSDGLAPVYHLLDQYDNASTFESEGTRQLDQTTLLLPEPLRPQTLYPPHPTGTSTTATSTSPSTTSTTTAPTTTVTNPSTPLTASSTPSFTTTSTPTTSSSTQWSMWSLPSFPSQWLPVPTRPPGVRWMPATRPPASQRPLPGRALITTTLSSAADDNNDNKLSLSVTVAVGCSLLFLNILIFAGMYYQKDRMRQEMALRKREVEKETEARVADSDIMKSSTGPETDTNSSSMATPPTSIRHNHHHMHSQQSAACTLPRHAIPVVPPQPPPCSNTLPYKHNSSRMSHQACDHHSHLDHYHDHNTLREHHAHHSSSHDHNAQTHKSNSVIEPPMQMNHLHSNPSTVV